LLKYREFFGAVVAALVFCAVAGTARAAYDIDTLGVPKFVNVNYIDLSKIYRVSRFRSMAGHNYSDSSQFGTDGYKDSTNRIEQCRSMKHYFLAPDSGVSIVSPVSGTVNSVRLGALGATVEIRSDVQPDFYFGIFHVNLSQPLKYGDHVTEGQMLGRHTGTETWSDMSVWVQTPRGKHLISYFETLTDAAFAPFVARGVASRDAFIRSKANRDADPNVCSFNNPPDSDFVALSGTPAATQTVSVQTTIPDIMHIGDTPLAIQGTATSGLPVVVVSATPKVCVATNNAVTPRRPGVCRIQVTQPGNATTYEASPATFRTTVLPTATPSSSLPRLASVFPTSNSGPQSYLRFFNTGATTGTVTASLIDGATGQVVAKWQSPPIAAGASPQFPVSVLEAAATAPFTRPSLYGLRIEPETTMPGFMQHVLYNSYIQTLTNASTCDIGTTANAYRLMNVHSSLFDAAYPSTIVLNNIGITSLGMNLTMRNAADGANVGRFISSRLAPALKLDATAVPNAQLILNESAAETAVQPDPLSPAVISISPPSAYHFNMIDEGGLTLSPNSTITKYYYQHLITNKGSNNTVVDMSTVCALNGRSTATANAEVRAGAIFSTLQTSGESYLRFYNSGDTAGTVTVTLYGTKDDQPLGTWVSPVIAAGAMQEIPIATVERELTLHQIDVYKPPALVKQNHYGIGLTTDIDGFFQHVLWRTPDGAYSNLSTCYDAVTSETKTLMAVNAPSMAAAGYISAIVVNNVGDAAGPVTFNFYDARDGSLAGSYRTGTIAADGVVQLDAGAMAAEAGLPNNPAIKHYIVKAAEPFTGFLQHFVHNTRSGVITDMTAACMM